MADEISEAFNYTFGALKTALASYVGGTPPRIYQMTAPNNPWELGDRYLLGVLMSPGQDFVGAGGVRLQVNPLIAWYFVKKGDIDVALRNADKAMDNVLTNVRATISNGYVFSVVREQGWYRTPRDPRQTKFSELGGAYRYYIRKQDGT
jgi:hypothetical protein